MLAGKYRVEHVLGRGGMGYVLAAVHVQLEQRVAVKALVPELCDNEEAVARFLREARAAVRIRSEHVAKVIDVGTLDDGAPYMVMEFLEGHDLSDELDARGPVPVELAVSYVLQACEAVAEAHALGIVHRDLKPANLFLTSRPDGSALIKVLDFGISKALLPQDQQVAVSLTATQGLLGSPNYMSPEQVRKPKTVDVRSDVWALGVILHELITGRLPFNGDTPMSILAAVVSDPTPRLDEGRPDVPPGLASVVQRCLEKEPGRRYQDIAELASALSPFGPPHSEQAVHRISGILRNSELPRAPISSEPGTAEGSVDSGAPTLIVAADSNPSVQRTAVEWEGAATRRPRSARSLVFSVAGVGALLGAAALGYGLAQRGAPEKPFEITPDAAPTAATVASPALAPAEPSRSARPEPSAPEPSAKLRDGGKAGSDAGLDAAPPQLQPMRSTPAPKRAPRPAPARPTPKPEPEPQAESSPAVKPLHPLEGRR